MFESLFDKPFTVQRHRNAPLLEEREKFLQHLFDSGNTRSQVSTVASTLLQVIRFLGLKILRDVQLGEILRAAKRWHQYRGSSRQGAPGASSAIHFTWIVKKWLLFLGRLILPKRPRRPYADKREDYREFMEQERKLAPDTILSRFDTASQFLKWIARRHRGLSTISLDDADQFFAFKARHDWNRIKQAHGAARLRAFVQYAEQRNWCASGIAAGISGPSLHPHSDPPDLPTKTQVQRLLISLRGTRPAAIRARVVLYLCAAYALRTIEVTRLLLTDFDWQRKTFVVRRAKRARLQYVPVEAKVGRAIRAYISEARPKCQCKELFVTLHAPFRPISRATLADMVSNRFKKLGIVLRRTGPYSLRRARAMQLLEDGASLKDICDFLGHRNTRCVRFYARFSLESLREVADLELSKLL